MSHAYLRACSAALFAVLASAISSCSSTSSVTVACTAGEKVVCDTDACTGTKTCNADGRSFTDCTCDVTGTGGATATGGSAGTATGGLGGAGGSIGGATGTVVTALDQLGAGKAEVAVVVHDSTGHVVDTTKTGADGKVAVTIPTGGAVTVADKDLTTFLAASDARSIVAMVGDDPSVGAPAFPAGTTLTLNLSSPLNLAYYDVAIPPCVELFERQTDAQAVYDLSSCPQGKIDIYVIGYTSSGYPFAFATLFNVTPSMGSNLTQSLSVSTSTFNNVSGSIGPLPVGVTGASESLKLRRAGRYAGSFSDSQTPTTGTASYNIVFPAIAVDGFRLQQGIDWPGHTARRDTRVSSLASSQGTWAPLGLKPVNLSSGVTFPDTGRALATWSLGDGQLGDVIAIWLMWSPSSGTSSSWTIIVPPSETQAETPELPATLSGYGIGAGATVSYYEVAHMDMPTAKGYLEYLSAPIKPLFLGYFGYHTQQNCEVIRSSATLP